MPQNDDGPRMEPPVSVPSPPRIRPAATATPVPELEPPGKRLVSHGFLGIGKPGVGVGKARRELVQDEFAEHDRAGLAQADHDARRRDRRPRRGPARDCWPVVGASSGRDDVFDAERDAVEGTFVDAGFALARPRVWPHRARVRAQW